MADIYDRSRAMAIRMLAPRSKGGKGLELRLTKFEQGEYDPATGGSPTIERRFDGSGMRQDYDVRVIDGSLIQQGDVEIIMSPVQLGGRTCRRRGTATVSSSTARPSRW
ncbi:hypothetical protein [Pseudomonas aeruginosa]|uniref:hypothetical protein n=1 Tax=Pseudomonas aeruginosa TaxID=287 RepID=UPI001EDFBF75|nr:hypothetical protein [Pseudomonas aeruginosa]